jgi:hypothetical protein
MFQGISSLQYYVQNSISWKYRIDIISCPNPRSELTHPVGTGSVPGSREGGPALSTELLTGTVAVVVPQADEQARTFPVKIRLARVALLTGAAEKMKLVPKDAIVLERKSPLVIVAKPAAGKKTLGTQEDVEPGQKVRLTRGVAVDFEVLEGVID